MPRIAEDSKSLAADLASRLSRLVAAATAEGREEALAEVRSLIGRGRGEIPIPKRRGAGRPKGSKNKPKTATATSRKKRRSSWAGLTPAEHLATVNALRVGRGLAPETSL